MRNEAYRRREFGRWGRAFPFLFFNAALAFAAPAVLLETTRLAPADGAPNGGFGRTVAIDGNIAVVAANSNDSIYTPYLPGAVYVFERNSQGVWQQTAKLDSGLGSAGDSFGFDLAVDGNVIAVGDWFSQRVYVFEKQGASWVRVAALGGTTPNSGNGYSVALQGDLITLGHGFDNGMALYRRGAGGWQQIASYNNGTHEDSAADWVGPSGIDVTAGLAVHNSYGRVEEDGVHQAPIYFYSPGANGNWAAPTITSLIHPDGNAEFGSDLSISGDTLLASGFVFGRDSNGTWTRTGTTPGAQALDDNESTVIGAVYRFGKVYERDPSGAWSRAAELITSSEHGLNRIDVNSNRVLASSYSTIPAQTGQAFIFELPTTLERPSLLQDDFQDGNAQGWMTLGGTFGVISNGKSLVYRQSNTAGNAAALLPNANYGDQAIQADIVPRAFDGADRWFGLVARYVDAANYYYVTARSGGGVQLKKIMGGSFTTLGSAPLAVTLNRTHRLRLEAVGDYVRVLVNERPVITVRDDDISGGQPGVMMYRTRADYDNVLVNANPGAAAVVEDFNRPVGLESQGWWSQEPAGPAGDFRYLQEDVRGAASAMTFSFGAGRGTQGNQIVTADLRPMQFSGADRWIGLTAHYGDANNYLYVTLRSSNTLQIKKLVNGAIQTLATVPFPVATNTTYRVRLETVESRIRVYVNGELTLEATDTPNSPSDSPSAKRAGVLMYKTSATVDNFSLFQP